MGSCGWIEGKGLPSVFVAEVVAEEDEGAADDEAEDRGEVGDDF